MGKDEQHARIARELVVATISESKAMQEYLTGAVPEECDKAGPFLFL